MTEKKIYNLSAVTQAIGNVINKHCNNIIWVKAEIVKLNYYSKSGHAYPDLVEKKEGKVLAEIRGNIWNNNFTQINNKFKKILNEGLGDNMTIVCLAKVKYSPVYGLSLDITDIDPSYTLGELAKQKAETIRRLKNENIFTLNKETIIPKLPKTFAIISIESSKGYSDFINVLNNNPWGYKFHHLLFPAILQGDNATKTIIAQLEIIKRHTKVFDFVTIIRGGGGDVGLSCYDNFCIAKEIATFPIPVLTGIGHSTNETVAELVSYKNFITPTKVAEFLIQQYHNFYVPVKENIDKINSLTLQLFEKQVSKIRETARLFDSITNRLIDYQKNSIIRSAKQIENSTQRKLTNESNNLKANINIIQYSVNELIQHQKHTLIQSMTQLKSSNELIINNQYSTLSDLKKYVILYTKNTIEIKSSELNNLKDKITILSPINTLKRGFSITRLNGKSITSSTEVTIGDSIQTEVYEGSIESKIEKVKSNKKSILQWLKK